MGSNPTPGNGVDQSGRSSAKIAGSNPASNLLESHNGIALKDESPFPKMRTFQISQTGAADHIWLKGILNTCWQFEFCFASENEEEGI